MRFTALVPVAEERSQAARISLGIALSVLVGCGRAPAPIPTSPTTPLPLDMVVPPAPIQGNGSSNRPRAGPYTLTVEADESCPNLPAAAKVRTYDVAVRETPYAYYLSVQTLDGSLGGDFWFPTGHLRWNGGEWDIECGTFETIGSISFCLWGQGPWAVAEDGTVSGVLAGGVDFGEQHCLKQNNRFVMRPKRSNETSVHEDDSNGKQLDGQVVFDW